MKKILYVDGCVNRQNSRTERLAQSFLRKLDNQKCCQIYTLILEDLELKPLDSNLLSLRNAKIAKGDYSHATFEAAQQFALADEIVIAAPYWDMSFPAMVKIFIENICVNGLTFRYNACGIPEGLTNIKSATFITTAGGFIGDNNFGFAYLKGIFNQLFGIKEVNFICAEGLDIAENNPDEIIQKTLLTMKRQL